MTTQTPPQSTEPKAEQQQFLAVPLSSFRINTWMDFSLYLQVGEKYVLYRDEGYPVFGHEALQRLNQNNVQKLYILASDRPNYLRYAVKHLGDILADSEVPIVEKAKVIYGANLHMAQEVFDHPTSTETFDQAERVIAPIVDQILIDIEPLRALLPILSHHYTTYVHSANVSIYAMFLAHRYGIDNSEHVRQIGLAGMLHDIGKAKVGPQILDKPGQLSEAEWNVIRLHPVWGVELLDVASYRCEVTRDVVRQHHERCDGTGYPDGLSRRDIAWEAKLVAIADIFDALTTTRSYKDNMSSYDALNMMKGKMISGLDVNLFRNLILLLGGV